MRDVKHLELRGRTWYCVRDVPRPLQGTVGKKRFVVSLRTQDLMVAQARRYEALVTFERVMDTARRTAPGPNAIITAGLAYRDALARIEAGDPAAVKVHGGSKETGWWDGAPNAHDLTPQQRAAINADAVLEIAADDIRDTHGDDAASTFLDVARRRATPLMHHVDDWLKEGGSKGAFTARTKGQYRHDLGRLETWANAAGVPCTVEAITCRIAGRYVHETITAPQVHNVTGNRWVSAASTYWKWLMKRAGVEMNPWTGQSLAKPAEHRQGARSKRAVTDDELRALLAGDPGDELADLIRVAALSGMRLEEVYRLTVADCADGWFAVRVSKTRAGRRRVPIHADLAAIVARRRVGKAPDAFLFHEAGAKVEGRGRSMAVSKAFGRYRQAQGVHERADGKRHSAVDFHSLRRWFVTTARNAGQDQAMVAAVVGHETGNLTDDVYSGGPSDARRRAVVEAVRLPDE